MKKMFLRFALFIGLFLVGFASPALAEEKPENQTLDLYLKVSEYTGNDGGKVAMSRFFISGDNDPKTPEAEGKYPGSGWNTTQNMLMKAEIRATGKFNQVIVYAKPNPGYTFSYWADADNKTKKPSAASTKETTIHSGLFGYLKRQLCQNNPWASEVTKDGYFGAFFHFHVSGTFTDTHHPSYTLYAVFEPIEYTVTFNPGDGSSVEPTSKKVKFNTAYGTLPTPSAKAGYTFAGWYNSKDEQVLPSSKKTSASDETLTAKWNEIKYTIHFVDDEQHQAPADAFYSVADGHMPALPASTYLLQKTDKYFAGYYTQLNGAGERVYAGFAENGNLKLLAESKKLTSDVTLYAHYSHIHHNMYWDYTYLDAASTATPKPWRTMEQEDQTDRIQNARLNFFHAGATTPFKSVILHTENPINKQGTPTSDFDTHTTAEADIHLYVGASTPSGSVITEFQDGEYKVFFTDEELSDFHSYTFEPIKNNQEAGAYVVATMWAATTEKTTHNTILTFNGATNCFSQSWSVTLSGLLINPDVIYVMPLFASTFDGEGKPATWDAISQIAHTAGVPCQKTSEDKVNKTATYTGSYLVWKESTYAIGLVGFNLGGKDYWMNKDDEGAFAPFYNSANYVGATEGITVNPGTNPNGSTGAIADLKINMTVPATAIPVIHFLPNGGVLATGTPNYLVNAYNATGTVSLSAYTATREGYTFNGWKKDATEGGQVVETLPTTRAFTLSAQWEGNKYEVKLYKNDGTQDYTSVQATYMATMPTISKPVRAGYDFQGYWDANDVKYYDENAASARNYDKMVASDLFAGWKAKTTTVSFDLNGPTEGSAPAQQTATYDEALTDLQESEIPTWDNHIFLGFFDDQTDGTMYMDENGHSVKLWDKEDATATLYAHWRDTQITLKANEDPKNPGHYYATCYYGTKMEVDGNTTIFKGVLNGQRVDFVEASEEIIPAGNAVILHSTQDVIFLHPTTENPTSSDYSNNALSGVDVETNRTVIEGDPKTQQIYTLAAEFVNGETEKKTMAFYKYSDTKDEVAAHKAFLLLPVSNGNAPYRIDFVLPGNDPIVTGVENTECIMQSAKCIVNGRIVIKRGDRTYDLNGRLVK